MCRGRAHVLIPSPKTGPPTRIFIDHLTHLDIRGSILGVRKFYDLYLECSSRMMVFYINFFKDLHFCIFRVDCQYEITVHAILVRTTFCLQN